jgi:transcriptional regulator with XRE-family HTH domain
MTDTSYNKWNAISDRSANELLGRFIKLTRLRQNKTQGQLATDAGIARSTLSLFEKGENSSLMVFIQLLRALNMLHLLEAFEISEQLSPLQLAKFRQKQRKRAGRKTEA